MDPALTRCPACQRDVPSLHRGMCAACYKAWRKDNFPPNVTCEHCGRRYFDAAPKNHTLCSRECYRAWKLGRNGRNDPTDGEKFVERSCEWCGRTFGTHARLVARGGGRYCSTACAGIARRKDPGTITCRENVWRQWRGYSKIRNAVLHAPDVRCARCGELRTHNNLVVHHPVPPRGDPHLLFDPNNQEILCRRCHMQEHHRRGDLRVGQHGG